MSLQLAGEIGEGALSYLGDSTVQAVASKIEKEISNFGLSDIDNIINRFLPGKRNKQKRKAVKHHVTRGHGHSRAAVAIGTRVNRMAPRFRSSGGTYHVCNREFVGDVLGDGTFLLEEFTCQPGLSSLFPWLSQIAPTHQKYRFTKLVFSYVPVAPTSTAGRVTMAFAIDPLDQTVGNKQELFQYPNSVETSVWDSSMLPVDVSSKGWLFTRSGFVADTDLKTYDAGKFLVASSNVSSTDVIGEIFVDYEVQLMTPKPTKCPASQSTFVAADMDGTDPLISFTNLLPLEVDGGDWFFDRRGTDSLLVFRNIGEFLLHIEYSADTAVGNLTLIDGDQGSGNGSITLENNLTHTDGSATGTTVAVIRVNSRKDSQGLEASVRIGTSGSGAAFTDFNFMLVNVTEFNTFGAQRFQAGNV